MKQIITTFAKEVANKLAVKEYKPEVYTLRAIDKEKRCSFDTPFLDIQDAIKSISPESIENKMRYILVDSKGKYIKLGNNTLKINQNDIFVPEDYIMD